MFQKGVEEGALQSLQLFCHFIAREACRIVVIMVIILICLCCVDVGCIAFCFFIAMIITLHCRAVCISRTKGILSRENCE